MTEAPDTGASLNDAPPGGPPPSRGFRLATALGVADAGRILRYFVTYLPTQAIPAIAGFLVLPVLARMLFPTELGVLALTQTVVTLGWTVVGSWLAAAIIRELPAHRERGDMAGFRQVLVRGLLAVGGASVGFLLFLLAIGAGSSAVGDNVPYIFAAMFGLVIQNMAVSLFAAALRPRAYALVEATARVGGIGLGVVLVWKGHGTHGYLLGLALASTTIGVTGLLFSWPRERVRPGGAPPADLAPWIRYGVPASTAAVAMWGLSFIDRYILALLKDAGTVGIYTVGNVVGDRVISIPMFAFFAAAGPLLMTAFERHGRPEVERLMAAYTRVILLVGLPMVACIAAVAPDLIPLLTGSAYGDYSDAAPVAPIIALGSLMFALGSVATIGLTIAKRTRPLIWAALAGLVVNVAVNFVLIPPFGGIGAAIATPIGMAAYVAAACAWGRRHATWHFPWGTLWRTLAASGAALGAAIGIRQLGGSAVAHIAISLASASIVYVLGLVLLGERRRAGTLAPASS